MWARRLRKPVGLGVVATVATLAPVSVHWEAGRAEGGLWLVEGLGAVVRVNEACALGPPLCDPNDPGPCIFSEQGCEPDPFDFCAGEQMFEPQDGYTCGRPEDGCT